MNFLLSLAGILRRAAHWRSARVGASDGESSPPVSRRVAGVAARRQAHGARGVCHVQAETTLFQQETFADVGKDRGLACRTGICHRDARAAATDCLAQQSGNIGAKPVSNRCRRRADESFDVRTSGGGISAGVFSRPVRAARWRGRAAAADVLIARPNPRTCRTPRRARSLIRDPRCAHDPSPRGGRRNAIRPPTA